MDLPLKIVFYFKQCNDYLYTTCNSVQFQITSKYPCRKSLYGSIYIYIYISGLSLESGPTFFLHAWFEHAAGKLEFLVSTKIFF